MEELKEIIATAVEQGVRQALENANFATSGNNDLLTVEQVHQEFDIGINMVQKMFKDPELPVQRYTKPFKVSRQALNEYMTKEHNYLKGGK